jgi:signal transduction histidine kinase
MIRKLFIVFLLVVSCHKDGNENITIHKEIDEFISSEQYDIEKIKSNLKRARILCDGLPNDSIKSYYYRKISCEYYNYSLWETYYNLTKENIVFSKKINDTLTLGKLYYDLGDYFYEKNLNDSSFYYYNKALKTIPILNKEKIRTLFNIAKLYKNENQLIESEVQLIKTISYAKAKNNVRLLYECYSVLGGVQNGLKNYTEAIKSYHISKNYLNKIPNDELYPVLVSENYNNTANVYLNMKDYPKAIEFYQKGLKIGNIKIDSPKVYAILTDNLTYAKLKSGTLKSPDKFFEALRIRDSLDNKLGIIMSQQRIGEYYLREKDSSRALQHFSIAYDLAKQTRTHRDQLVLLKLKKQANPAKAAKYQEIYINLSDSLLLEERNTRNKFAKIEFETEEIEQEKTDLAKKMNFILILSTLTVFLLGTLYFLYRQKVKNKVLVLEKEQQKSNEEVYNLLLTQQQQVDQVRAFEKKRIATELHDGVISELFGIRLHLERLIFLEKEVDKANVENYLGKLNSLENEIRQISHKLAEETAFRNEGFILLVENYLDEFENDFAIETDLLYDASLSWEILSNEQKINLFRIIQEALTNVRKYAKAKKVTVSFGLNNSLFEFSIVDDGIGFDTSKNKNGIGLTNMHFRLENLNGNLHITSTEKGTTIKGNFPV